MSQWNKIVSMMALSGAAALAGTGCLAQSPDQEATDDQGVGTTADEQAATGGETTGETKEACGGWGGWGFAGFIPGCGSPWFHGFCGGGGFGFGCGWGGGFGGWGGFGGCGGCF